MDWKYYIPHVWHRDRQVWEDVYLLVRSVDFSREELLDWVLVWLREKHLAVTKLVAGSTEDFRGKSVHVDLIELLKHRFGHEEKVSCD